MLFLFGPSLLLRFLSCIIERKLRSYFASVFALECELLPEISLAASKLDDVGEIYPCLPDEVGLLVIIEHRYLQLVVVG